MSQDPPNPGFRYLNLENWDFLKKDSQDFKNSFQFGFLWIPSEKSAYSLMVYHCKNLFEQNLNDSTERKCPHCGLEWRSVLSCYWYTLHNVLLTEWLMWDLLIFGLVYAVVTWWNNVKYGWVLLDIVQNRFFRYCKDASRCRSL